MDKLDRMKIYVWLAKNQQHKGKFYPKTVIVSPIDYDIIRQNVRRHHPYADYRCIRDNTTPKNIRQMQFFIRNN